MSTKGILIFANNNQEMDYGKFAVLSAEYAQHHLDVPVSLVTDKGTHEWLTKSFDKLPFDKIIYNDMINSRTDQKRHFYDGSLNFKVARFDNGFRSSCYDLTPYDKTLVIDADLILRNSKLGEIWDTDADFMISSRHFDLSRDRQKSEFKRVSDTSIDFYWATAFYFTKNPKNEIFFDLCKHILINYEFYRNVYQIDSTMVRNDYIFSIAIHILGGFKGDYKPVCLPCDIYYTLDTDELIDLPDSKSLVFLLQKENFLGEYTAIKIKDQNIHIMNKYSLSRSTEKMRQVLNG